MIYMMNMHSTMENPTEVWTATRQGYTGYNNSTAESHAQGNRELNERMREPAQVIRHPPPFSSTPTSMGSTAGIPGVSMTTQSGSVRSLPIRCMVQRSGSDVGAVQLTNANTLVHEGFAILPGKMLFKDIVRAALVKLGFPSSEIIRAKAFIQLRNWKPLPVCSIADQDNCTIEEILGDITSAATLIICLSKIGLEEIEWTDESVRAAVFQLLKEMSQTCLAKLGPLPQSMISNIVNAKYMAKISTCTCQEFGLWYREYRKIHQEPLMVSDTTCQNSRQTFHSTFELPMMRAWHDECPNPSDEDLKQYLTELNSTPIRQERGPVSLQRLKMWWRNEKHRRERKAGIARLRQLCEGTPGPQPSLLPPRPRKPRRRKSLKGLTPFPSGDQPPWDNTGLNYAAINSFIENNDDSMVESKMDFLPNQGKLGQGYENSANQEKLGHGYEVSANQEKLGHGYDVPANQEQNKPGRDYEASPNLVSNVYSKLGHSESSDPDLEDGGDGCHSPNDCNSIDVEDGEEREYECPPESQRDIDAVTRAAIYSSIHVFNNMIPHNNARTQHNNHRPVFNHPSVGNSSPGIFPNQPQLFLPPPLRRAVWN